LSGQVSFGNSVYHVTVTVRRKYHLPIIFWFLAIVILPTDSPSRGFPIFKLSPPESIARGSEQWILDQAFDQLTEGIPTAINKIVKLADSLIIGNLVVDRLVKMTKDEDAIDKRKRIFAAVALTEVLLRRLPNRAEGYLFEHQRSDIEAAVVPALTLGITQEEEWIDKLTRRMVGDYLVKIGPVSVPHLKKVLQNEFHHASKAHDDRQEIRIQWAVFKAISTMEIVLKILDDDPDQQKELLESMASVLVLGLTYDDISGSKSQWAIEFLKNLGPPAVNYLSPLLWDESWYYAENPFSRRKAVLIIGRALGILEGIGRPALEVLTVLEEVTGLHPDVQGWVESSMLVIAVGHPAPSLLADAAISTDADGRTRYGGLTVSGIARLLLRQKTSDNLLSGSL